MEKNTTVPMHVERQLGIDIYKGNFDIVILAIEEYQLDINAIVGNKNETLLACATRGITWGEDNTRLVTYLLKNGADPNIRDESGTSAFHKLLYSSRKMAELPYLDLVQLYIEHGKDVNAKDEYTSTSFFNFIKEVYDEYSVKGVAIKNRCLEIIKLFLARGADPDIKNKYGDSARYRYVNELAAVHKLYAEFAA